MSTTSSSLLAPEHVPYSNKDMETAIKILKGKKIVLYEHGENEYERYIATSNLIYRFSTPPCVVRPKCPCDVREVINIANSRNIPITIKNGGHSFAGGSTTNIGILMELGLMNQVDVDMTEGQETVTVKGGAIWFDVYKRLTSERIDGKRLNGWMANGGRCPTVGVSGFMLGGGLSPFTRSFGMGCDTVKEFTIVTAKGDEVTVSKMNEGDKNKDNLFWALCGAGGGNFGVVVQMKLALKKLTSDFVVAGRFTWYPKKDEVNMHSFMATMKSFYTWNWPNEMTIDSSWLCDLQESKSDIGVRFLVYYNGERSAFNKAIDAWTLENAPSQHEQLKKQLKKRSLEETSSRFLHETLATQWVEETEKAMPTTKLYQIYTSFMFLNGSDEIEGITRTIKSEMERFREKFVGETALMQVTFIHSGGEANSKKCADTAFPWRRSIYHTYVMLQWDEKWLEDPMRSFLGQMKKKLREYGRVKWATYINFPDFNLMPDASEQAYYGNNSWKLRDIKQIWDPDDFFKWRQGIRLPSKANQKAIKRIVDDSGEPTQNLSQDQVLLKEEALTDVVASRQWETFNPPDLSQLSQRQRLSRL